MSALKHLKRAAFGISRGAGLLHAAENSRWRRNRLLILCYHGISAADEHLWDPTLYMSPVDFERRLAILKRNGCTVLPLGEALERLRARDLPPKSAVITFDDGASDFYTQAWPLLRAYGFPVTVYLTTYYCEDNRPVFNTTASYLLWKGRGRELKFDVPLGLRTDDSRRAGWQSLLSYAAEKGLSAAEKDELLQRLAECVGADYAELRARRLLHIMNPDEVRELAAAGVAFELHTHRHRTPADRDLFLREIRDNRDRIRALAGTEPRHFCYPCGDYRLEFLPWLREEGVISATTCEPGLAARASDPLLLPRFVDHANLSLVEFEAYASGPALLLARGR